jgi:hypothetical protein
MKPLVGKKGHYLEGKLLASSTFRLLNFELFARNNRLVMVIGTGVFLTIAAYFLYDNYHYKKHYEEATLLYEARRTKSS